MGGASMGGFEDLDVEGRQTAVAFMVACETVEARPRFYDPLLRLCGVENPAFERRQRQIQRIVGRAGNLAAEATGED